ncbi:MAG: membrane protein insertion efficiency factor YidD [Alphaproteobacteria bacterium]|nr:membrane protein insertion efficiency factor YidD [Alphaproteobacteria bacterium]
MKYLSITISLILRGLIIAYRYGLSPVLGANCRYAPSCSAYAQEAIDVHGPWTGSWLAVKRVSRCHPWGGAGYDPVPVVRSCNHDHGSAPLPAVAKLPEG